MDIARLLNSDEQLLWSSADSHWGRRYAVTDQRVLILDRKAGRVVNEAVWSDLENVRLANDSGGKGTIHFDQIDYAQRVGWPRYLWPGNATAVRPISFANVDDPDSVFAIIREQFDLRSRDARSL